MNQKESSYAFELLSQDEMINIDAGGWFSDLVDKAKEIASVIPTMGKVTWGVAYYIGTNFLPNYQNSGSSSGPY